MGQGSVDWRRLYDHLSKTHHLTPFELHEAKTIGQLKEMHRICDERCANRYERRRRNRG